MLRLFLQEILIQNKSYHIVKHFLLFLLFALTSTVIINPIEDMHKMGLILSIIYIPLFLLSNNYFIIKSDVTTGNMEFLLTSASSFSITIIKFLSITINGLISQTLMIPIIILFFHPTIKLIVIFYCCSILVLMLSVALTILISSIQAYFQNNTNFLTVMIMPIMFPNIIISGMIMISPQQISLLLIMLGINLILIPVILYLSQYLIDNIYHI